MKPLTGGGQEAVSMAKGRMRKGRITKDDGRYLIYYSFNYEGIERPDGGGRTDGCERADVTAPRLPDEPTACRPGLSEEGGDQSV